MKKEYGVGPFKNENEGWFSTDDVVKKFRLINANFLVDLAEQGVLEKRDPWDYPDKTKKYPPYSYRFASKKSKKKDK